ncbi:hypothetical protein K8Z61_11655 [Nocardioides sp. TRM66260-LWL]|uniref:hypothetical protein n=1 Tax=Nocardioides sp. TRM66260-LWL TaxID=2874478 RepID=UPI001CC7CBC5|nr:hypothetical protein [Nocardioides sp. TRM66260-LWL]MBZ5735150.1 hypothetical protein [Nocardioides sp. TRM66260-LWL]
MGLGSHFGRMRRARRCRQRYGYGNCPHRERHSPGPVPQESTDIWYAALRDEHRDDPR